MYNVISILLALLGFTLLSTGNVLTKAGSPWMKWQGRKDGRFRRYLAIWLTGLVSYNLSLIPNGMASKTLPPHIISAISGWEIIVIITLSYFFLKENIFVSDLIYSTIIVSCIFALSIVEKPTPVEHVDKIAFYILLSIPFLFVMPVLLKNIGVKPKTVLFSIFAGCSGGFTLVIMNVVVKEYGYNIMSYFSTPYPYLFVFSATAAFIALQLAIRWGDMMLVGPIQNSFIIIYPVICSYFMFNSKLGIIQIATIVIIIYSCIAILRKH
jgi:multidrug transporter EmrE-like cation transporter